MFNEVPAGFKAVDVDREKELVHTFTINDDGQVIFGTQFLKEESGLLRRKEATYVQIMWNDTSQQLIIAFASEAQVHGDDPNFDDSKLDENIC